MSTKFKTGDTVYNIHGQAATYVDKINGYHVVKFLYEEDGEVYEDNPRIVSKVFSKPPTAELDLTIKLLEEKRDQLQEECNRKRQELAELNVSKETEKELRARLNRIEAFQRVDDFINGRITHYVIESPTGFEIVGPKFIEEHNRDGDYRYNEKHIKLLSLGGKSNGNLSWAINKYRDYSGNWDHQVWPCRSKEEAIQKIKDQYSEIWKKDFDRTTGLLVLFVENAKSFGCEIPVNILSKYKKAKRDKLLAARKQQEEQTACYERNLAKIIAQLEELDGAEGGAA